MNTSLDYYAILGVSPTADQEDIRRAYRNMAQRLHPDRNHHPGAENQFRDINAAYDILNDPIKRRDYDMRRKNNDPAYFTVRLTPSKRIMPLMPEPQVLYLLVELIPNKSYSTKGVKNETPLNISIVIDRSTSMNGVRLDRVKVAANQIIDHLAEYDVMSVVAFSDRAEVMVKSELVVDKNASKAMISMMPAFGGTEIAQGLEAAYKEVKRYASKKFVNHIILITDGYTYGDAEQCLEIAELCAREGIGISVMGIGDEWNDEFLDDLVGRTGGACEYIYTPNAVVTFLNNRVRALGQTIAERVAISVAPDPDVKLESVFRLTPSPQPISIDKDPIQIGQVVATVPTTVLFQLQLTNLTKEDFRSIMRIDVTGDILREQRLGYKVIADATTEVSTNAPNEEPPGTVVDALGKLTLYRMQQKATEAARRGNVQEATNRLRNLATRLLASGQSELAQEALEESQRIAETVQLPSKNGMPKPSSASQKSLKFGTRRLMLPAQAGSDSNGNNDE
jgi:Ca-activated chloride channel homolog